MEDECTHKITPPNINNVNTCTMFFHDNQSYLLGLLVETVEASNRSTRTPGHKLVFVPDNLRDNYLIFNDAHMPPSTQCTSIMDTECTAMTSSKSINIVLKYCIFQYPIEPTSLISASFKITGQQLLPIQSSNDSSSTDLKETARKSIYKNVCNGRFTGHDYDGTKINGWLGPKHIDLYLSWLLHTNRICNKSLVDIMILPYIIFCEFEGNGDNKNDALTSSMYDHLVLKQKGNIIDAKIVFIIIFRGCSWLLVVLVDFNQCNIGSNCRQTFDKDKECMVDSGDVQNNVQKKKPSVFYFALYTFTKNKDPTTKIDDKYADLSMEKKFKSFIDLCWKKRGLCFPNHYPKSFLIVTYFTIPLLFPQVTGK